LVRALRSLRALKGSICAVNESGLVAMAGAVPARAALDRPVPIVRALAADLALMVIERPRCHPGSVNAIVIETTRGRDGKRYPAGGDLPPDQRNRARWLAHNLVHRDGMSIRAAQRVMLEQYAMRRSIGMIHRDLVAYECPRCAESGG